MKATEAKLLDFLKKSPRYRLIVIDESHNLRNRKASATARLRLIDRRNACPLLSNLLEASRDLRIAAAEQIPDLLKEIEARGEKEDRVFSQS